MAVPGEPRRPPPSRAPALLAAHAALLVVLTGVSAALDLTGVRTSGHDDAGRWTPPPAAVPAGTGVSLLGSSPHGWSRLGP
ncbi:hypothetical protein [Geodermatophilus amargosae]|uniref:hypothetical protein n=1 Tax=Geodermatophilus amargosae TaxID=1296565 RepID=UPI0034DE94E3